MSTPEAKMAKPPDWADEDRQHALRESGDSLGRPSLRPDAVAGAAESRTFVVSTVDARPGLLAAAAVGPFFAVEQLGGESSWLPLSEFADHPDGLAGRVTATLKSTLLRPLQHTTSGVEATRVAASVAFLGLAARFVSPALGSLLCVGIVPILDWHQLCWRPALTGIVPLACGPVEGRSFGPRSVSDGGTVTLEDVPADQNAATLTDAAIHRNSATHGPTAPDPDAIALLLDTVITPTLTLGATVAARFGLSGQVVRGNVASAIAGAAVQVGRSGRCSEQAAAGLTAALLGQPELLWSGSFAARKGAPPRFRRNSCCLLYRAGGGLCGDCVLIGDTW